MIGAAAMANVRRIHRYMASKRTDESETISEAAIQEGSYGRLYGCIRLVARLFGHFGNYFDRHYCRSCGHA
jgi:hypothetical protein